MATTLSVKYTGTNVGKIYFSDIDRRHQLGGAPEGGNYGAGQDQYIVWGETKILQLTDDVGYSRISGVLKYFSTAASSSAFVNGAPLTLAEGSFTAANEVPRSDIGDTGTGRFVDSYMNTVLSDKYSTGIAGATGYFYGNTL
jgi:hypothetical protein